MCSVKNKPVLCGQAYKTKEVKQLANTRSAKKRIKIIAKMTLRNKIIKTRTKTAVKKLRFAMESGNKEETGAAFIHATSAIDKAASKGVFHKNTAARKKSRMAKMVNRAAL